MSGYTQGLWSKDQYGNVVDEQEDVIKVSGFALSGSTEAKANSERIIACVNACEGLSNDKLEKILVDHGSMLNYFSFLFGVLND